LSIGLYLKRAVIGFVTQVGAIRNAIGEMALALLAGGI
jgi:hypothetical protein